MHAFSIILEQVSLCSNLASYNVRACTSNVRYSMRASIGRAPHIWLSFLLPSGVGIQLGASILSGRAGPGMPCMACTLPEIGTLPSAVSFTECILSGT